MTEHQLHREVLKLFSDVLAEVDTADDGSLLVLPVIVDDFKRFAALVTEIARFSGALLGVADDAVDGVEITRGALDPDLVSLVESIALDPAMTGTPTALNVTVDAHRYQVRLGSDLAPTNPGDRNFLGLCAALLDPHFTRQSLGFVAYDEGGMASDIQQRAWDLLMDLPELVGHGRGVTLPKVLVAVVGASEVNVGRHCQPARGVRWTMTGGKVRRRRRFESDRSEIGKIAAGDGPIVLFLGAGASYSSNLPLGDELRDAALALQVPDLELSGSDFRNQAEEFFRATAANERLMPGEDDLDTFVETLTLERVLREEAHQAGAGTVPQTLLGFDELQKARLDSPGKAVQVMRSLLRVRRRLILVTVNFDQLIEHNANVLRAARPEPSVPQAGDPANVRMFVTDSELRAFPKYLRRYLTSGGAVPLLKLHGSIEMPQTVRANVDLTLPGLREPAARALEALAKRHKGALIPWTYVGCSMRDPDITQVINKRVFAENTNERWVAPLTDPHVETYVRRIRHPAWRAAGVYEELQQRSISLTADDFFGHLAVYLLK